MIIGVQTSQWKWKKDSLSHHRRVMKLFFYCRRCFSLIFLRANQKLVFFLRFPSFFFFFFRDLSFSLSEFVVDFCARFVDISLTTQQYY